MKTYFKDSLQELNDVRVIATCGILTALAVALKFVASIDIGQYIRIGISDMPSVAASSLFGPAVGCIFWAVLDIIKYIVAPTGPFFPGFTISAAISGMIFGMILYRRPLTVQRVFAAELINKVVISVFLNTIWLSILYGNAITMMLPARLLSAAIMLPIDTALTFIVMQLVQKIWIGARQGG